MACGSDLGVTNGYVTSHNHENKPQPEGSPVADGDICISGKMYRYPNEIPPSTKKHLSDRHRAYGKGSSIFCPCISLTWLQRLILYTAKQPCAVKVDRCSKKTIYRFQRFDRPIGYHGNTGESCHWLVVVSKGNSWIKTTYPVTESFKDDHDLCDLGVQIRKQKPAAIRSQENTVNAFILHALNSLSSDE